MKNFFPKKPPVNRIEEVLWGFLTSILVQNIKKMSGPFGDKICLKKVSQRRKGRIGSVEKV